VRDARFGLLLHRANSAWSSWVCCVRSHKRESWLASDGASWASCFSLSVITRSRDYALSTHHSIAQSRAYTAALLALRRFCAARRLTNAFALLRFLSRSCRGSGRCTTASSSSPVSPTSSLSSSSTTKFAHRRPTVLRRTPTKLIFARIVAMVTAKNWCTTQPKSRSALSAILASERPRGARSAPGAQDACRIARQTFFFATIARFLISETRNGSLCVSAPWTARCCCCCCCLCRPFILDHFRLLLDPIPRALRPLPCPRSASPISSNSDAPALDDGIVVVAHVARYRARRTRTRTKQRNQLRHRNGTLHRVNASLNCDAIRFGHHVLCSSRFLIPAQLENRDTTSARAFGAHTQFSSA
jgi:hypothetical protein